MIRALFTAEGHELDAGAAGVVSGLHVIAEEPHGSAVQKSVTPDMAEPGVHTPVVSKQSAAHFHRLLVGVERTVGSGHFSVRLVAEVRRHHVGRRAHAALYLNAFQTGQQVGHIHPEHVVALGVVDGNAVDRDVDAAAVGASDAHRSVTDTGTGIARGHHRRRHRQHLRKVLAEIDLFNLFLRHIGKSDGSGLCGTGGNHLHLVHLRVVQTVQTH